MPQRSLAVEEQIRDLDRRSENNNKIFQEIFKNVEKVLALSRTKYDAVKDGFECGSS